MLSLKVYRKKFLKVFGIFWRIFIDFLPLGSNILFDFSHISTAYMYGYHNASLFTVFIIRELGLDSLVH